MAPEPDENETTTGSMARGESFPRGHPKDLPICQSHLLELDWMADDRNTIRRWVPENITCANFGIILFVIREDVDLRWHRSADGVLGYVLNLPGRCRVEVTMASIHDGVELTLSVSNLGEVTWRDTVACACTQLVAAPDFVDFARERTFYWRGGEKVLPGKGHFSKAVGPDDADPGFIATVSCSGRHVVGTGWETVHSLGGNDSRMISCIHSNPAFGDVAPGERVTRRGRIYLMCGTAEDALARYRHDFP